MDAHCLDRLQKKPPLRMKFNSAICVNHESVMLIERNTNVHCYRGLSNPRWTSYRDDFLIIMQTIASRWLAPAVNALESRFPACPLIEKDLSVAAVWYEAIESPWLWRRHYRVRVSQKSFLIPPSYQLDFHFVHCVRESGPGRPVLIHEC